MAEESFENSHNLENLLSPFCYEQETPLPVSTPEVPGGFYMKGFISQDCTWGCQFHQSIIKCFPIERYFEDTQSQPGNHALTSSVAVSSASYTFFGGQISCAAELAIHNPRTTSGARKLLLGISYVPEKSIREVRGAIVIFDPLRCRPMKWIEIPDPVSSITVLSHFEEGGSNRPFFNETMMAMVGIAAVGLRGGSVIIVDLGLDDLLATINAPTSGCISDMTYRLLNVNPHEYVIATKRHKAVSKRSLISLRFINEPEDEGVSDAFHYCKPNGQSILRLPKTAVAVTCVEYVPAIGSLLVGFTCGGFQIWRVNNMELQFTSEPLLRDRNLNVIGFSFQQPVDDPKNYCYVWVMYGSNTTECGEAQVELHSLYYESKAYLENFGSTYEGFKQCARRLAFPLVDDFLPTDTEEDDKTIRCSARPLRIWTQPDSELTYCAWEVGRGGVFYIGIFDLNQWYSNHTREYIAYNSSTGLCPYWVALPVEIPDISKLLLDIRVIPRSLMRWENPHSKLDVHLYPASLSFRAVCLTNSGVSAFEHFGIQEKLIRFMLQDGPNQMIQPIDLKNSFHRYGLEPVFPQVYGDQLSDKDRDRFFIFSVLLESRRTAAIIRLASVWLDGSYANVGCTIDLIIDWIASYMIAIRNMADEHWETLLTYADDTLPPETIHFINFSNYAWTSLHHTLLTLMNPTEVYSARGLELEDIEFGLGKLVQYSAALLMMYKAKLLPEQDKTLLRDLTEFYQRRRGEAKAALEKSSFVDNQYKTTHPLMIDHIMDSLQADLNVRDEWHVAEGEHLYPPQHVGYLVNMFMWPDVDSKAVSRVFMYFLFDLNWMYPQYNTSGPATSDAERKIRGDFKSVVESATEEYAEMFSLWLLDHEAYDEVLVHLKEKDRLFVRDGLPWCAATITLTAAGYENEIAELLLKSCPQRLARLLFCLMTSSSSKYNSLAELMVSSNFSADTELLQQFFEISEVSDRLGEFIRIKAKELPNIVREGLLIFLKSSDTFQRLSQLLMYYIHTEDYSKLEEEFVRIRTFLRQRNIADSERREWAFQENYIMHLLSSTKGSMMDKFLRLRSTQAAQSVRPTLSIKAMPVQCESPPQTSRLKDNSSKLPPQLRRLKLSETISSDPLSPLRRYAGRIQNAVAAPLTDADDHVVETLPRRLGRKSFSRISLRMSLGNTTAFDLNNSVQEDRNNTTRRQSFDLKSIFKTPSVDHRIENIRREASCSTMDTSQEKSIGECDKSAQLQSSVHSIMKERDSTKPKVIKKVELRLENLSASSEDEKEVTVYEDADENIGNEENDYHSPVGSDMELNMSQGSGDRTLLESASEHDLNFSQTNVADPDTNRKSTLADTTTGVHFGFGSDIASEKQHKVSQNVANISTSIWAQESLEEEVDDNGSRLADLSPTNMEQVGPVSSSASEEISCMEVSQPLECSDVRNLESSFTLFSSEKREEGKDEKTNQPEPMKAPSLPESPLRKADAVIMPTRKSSRSKTPVVETSQEDTERIKSLRQTRKSRSRTPTRDLQTESADDKIAEEAGDSKLSRSLIQESEGPGAKRIRRSSIASSSSSYQTDNISEETEDLSRRRSARISRSRTPTRDVSMELQEVPGSPPVRRSRTSRSRTPTRDAPTGSQEALDDVTVRRSSRVSRSRTPTRDLTLEHETLEKSSEGVEIKTESMESRPVRRSARTSQSRTREVFEDELYDDLESTIIRRSTRSTRSTTPTRDAIDEAAADLSHNTSIRRTLRATRSTTPNREIGDSSASEESQPKTRRTTRSTRSKTPNRELDKIPEEVETKPPRRGGRAKTPTREIKEEPRDEEEPKTVEETKQKGGSKKKVPEISSQADTEEQEDEPKDVKPKRPQKRRLKYFEHHQDLSTVIEDTSTEGTILEATILPSTSEVQPKRRIKGIKARPEEELEQSTKPNKRRKAVLLDDLLELDSEVASHTSNRSTSSRGSSKSRGTRRKGRAASQSKT